MAGRVLGHVWEPQLPGLGDAQVFLLGGRAAQWSALSFRALSLCLLAGEDYDALPAIDLRLLESLQPPGLAAASAPSSLAAPPASSTAASSNAAAAAAAAGAAAPAMDGAGPEALAAGECSALVARSQAVSSAGAMQPLDLPPCQSSWLAVGRLAFRPAVCLPASPLQREPRCTGTAGAPHRAAHPAPAF